MKKLLINGGVPLSGAVNIAGSKNAALPILAACLLLDSEITLHNIPAIEDVLTALNILSDAGAAVKLRGHTAKVNACDAAKSDIARGYMEKMRSSIFFLAPLLVKTGRAGICMPGGCNLGARPIDMHIKALSAMGAVFEMGDGHINCTAPKGLKGAVIEFRFPSVGATETAIMAAVKAKGTTVIKGAAREPEVCDLANFLISCGANIKGAGTDKITIKGTKRLCSASYTIIPDRIVAQTVLFAIAATGGSGVLKRINIAHISAATDILVSCGCTIKRLSKTALSIKAPQKLSATHVKTGVYPCFATDAGPLLAAALLKASGESTVKETIFANRFSCADQFAKLAADVSVDSDTLYINGVQQLRGTKLTALDLRGGAALAVAALCSNGQSEISGLQYIERGYEDIAKLFNSLGAHCTYSY